MGNGSWAARAPSAWVVARHPSPMTHHWLFDLRKRLVHEWMVAVETGDRQLTAQLGHDDLPLQDVVGHELAQLGLHVIRIDHLVIDRMLEEAGEVAEGRVEAFVASHL